MQILRLMNIVVFNFYVTAVISTVSGFRDHASSHSYDGCARSGRRNPYRGGGDGILGQDESVSC